MASYLREDPLQSYQFTPYQEDYNGILKTLQVKEHYWRAGVQKVKSAQENASGLSLTYENNLNKLKSFISDADIQLKKALASDLSIHDNASKAIDIYKPLYDPINNKEMLADHVLTEHYDNEVKRMTSDMKRENGKYFNKINGQYLMMSKQDFINNGKNGGNAFDFKGKEKSYIPFHDYTEGYEKAMKNCKASTLLTPLTNSSDYIDQTTTETLTLEQVKECIDSNLSDLDRQQLSINAYVKYKGNEVQLANNYLQIKESDVEAKKRKIVSIDVKLKTAKGEDYDFLINYKKLLEDEIYKYNKYYESASRGDYNFINDDNFDNIAYQVEHFNTLNIASKGRAYTKINPDVEANPFSLTKLKAKLEAIQSYANFEYNSKLQEQKGQIEASNNNLKNKNELQKELAILYAKGEGNVKYDEKTGEYTKSTEESEGFVVSTQNAEKRTIDEMSEVVNSISNDTQQIQELDKKASDNSGVAQKNVYLHYKYVLAEYEIAKFKGDKEAMNELEKNNQYHFAVGYVMNRERLENQIVSNKEKVEGLGIENINVEKVSEKTLNKLDIDKDGKVSFYLYNPNQSSFFNTRPDDPNEKGRALRLKLTKEDAKKLASGNSNFIMEDGRKLEVTEDFEDGYFDVDNFMDIKIDGQPFKIETDRMGFGNENHSIEFFRTFQKNRDSIKKITKAQKSLTQANQSIGFKLNADQKQFETVLKNSIVSNIEVEINDKKQKIELKDLNLGSSFIPLHKSMVINLPKGAIIGENELENIRKSTGAILTPISKDGNVFEVTVPKNEQLFTNPRYEQIAKIRKSLYLKTLNGKKSGKLIDITTEFPPLNNITVQASKKATSSSSDDPNSYDYILTKNGVSVYGLSLDAVLNKLMNGQ